jgi:hypothetical protein
MSKDSLSIVKRDTSTNPLTGFLPIPCLPLTVKCDQVATQHLSPSQIILGMSQPEMGLEMQVFNFV